MNLLKKTFVINLDSRTDRFDHVSSEFDKIGHGFQRFSAITHIDGAIGCTSSHIKCLELAIERDYEYVTICEDDITFTNPSMFLKSLRKFEDSPPEKWDILLLGGVVYSDKGDSYEMIRSFYARVYESQTTTGYVVPRHYMPVLLENFRSGLKQFLETGNRFTYAIDSHWKQLQRRDLWFFLTPPTIIQYANWSNIENSHTNYGVGMLRLQNIDVKIEDDTEKDKE
jgi:GR25 family glycosyltransferase involved in LPS biosynthesis